MARLQQEWARLLGQRKMNQLKTLLAELVTKLRYQYEGSSVDIATRKLGQRTGSKSWPGGSRS